MEIEGLIKIGIATRDKEKTTALLADTLSLVPGEAVVYPPFGMRYRILKLGNLQIEVTEPAEATALSRSRTM